MLNFDYDNKIMNRILLSIYMIEFENGSKVMLNPLMLGTDRDTRDRLLYKLYLKQYVTGLTVVSDMGPVIAWSEDGLSLTNDGCKYILANMEKVLRVSDEWKEDVEDFGRAVKAQ